MTLALSTRTLPCLLTGRISYFLINQEQGVPFRHFGQAIEWFLLHPCVVSLVSLFLSVSLGSLVSLVSLVYVSNLSVAGLLQLSAG